MIDYKKILVDKYGGHKSKMSSRQEEISLHNCPKCGKDGDHFSFNVLTCKGGCFSCGYTVFNFCDLIAHIENITIEAANIFVSGIEGKNKLDIIDDFFVDKNNKSEIKKYEHINVELPDEFILMIDYLRHPVARIPKVFTSRKYPLSIIEKFGLGYCETGKYANRIIFPVYCKDKKSFVARRIKDIMPEKYKNPLGSLHSQLLYGYNFISKDKIIFLTEGPTDVLRLASYEYFAVCSFGKKVSYEQIDLLVDLEPKEVVCVFDGDALKQNIKAFNKLSNRLDTTYIILPDEYDPDDCPRDIFESCYINRKNMSKLNFVEEFLDIKIKRRIL